MASLEGNLFTYPEVQTLLDGITIGGHRLSDEQQVLRIKEGWSFLFEMVRKDIYSNFTLKLPTSTFKSHAF